MIFRRSGFAPPFIMGQECLWNSEVRQFGDLISPVPGDLHKEKLNSGLGIEPHSILCLTCVNLGPLGQKG